jgi:DUF1680 family protein
LWVHFYHDSELDWHLEDGTPLHVTQQTKYPWQGSVQMTVSPAAEKNFALRVRIPGWSTSTKVLVNGTAVTGAKAGEYLAIQRMWKPGDHVTLEFDTRTTLIAANPLVTEDAGKVAVQRGPLIYCLEQPDQQAPVADVLLAKVSAPFAEEQKRDLLGGIVMLTHAGAAYRKPLESEPLYEPAALSRGHTTKPVELRFIPYYAWSNREPGAMAVWVPAPL